MDLKEVRELTMISVGIAFQQRAWPVQRPCVGSMPGVLEEEQD